MLCEPGTILENVLYRLKQTETGLLAITVLEGSTGQLRTRVNCAVLAAGIKPEMVCSNIRKLADHAEIYLVLRN
jgi:hypothetical protein